MSKDFITNQILSDTAQAIRHCENSVGGIAPVDYAERIRALDKYIPQPDALNFYMPNGGTISLNKIGSPTMVELEYSLDRGATWTVWQEDNDGNRSLVLNAGQRMYVRNTSETSTGFSTSSNNYYTFEFTTNTYANGNTNSLLCKTSDNAVLTAYCYRSLFAGCTSLINPPCLPSTTLSDFCYRSIFYGCSSMIVSPELPATTLAPNCYDRLLMDCTSIRTAPELPATNLASECYFGMFYNTSISVMPELPATTLANGCYRSMFSHCDLLESVLDLPANILVENCYNAMFYLCPSLNYIKTQMITITATYCLNDWLGGVSQTGDFYCPAELTIPTGISGIPSGWTRHDI